MRLSLLVLVVGMVAVEPLRPATKHAVYVNVNLNNL